MALLSHTDQSLLPSERIAGATLSEKERVGQQQYDAAMQSLMAELTDDELTVMIDRLSEQGFNEQVVDPKPV
jgi:hypothetical protein